MSLSLVGLLHPDGVARRARVIGGNCPAQLWPSSDQRGDARADLLVLAPTRRECQRPGWLRSAVEEVEHVLAFDGIVYVLAPPGWRATIGHLLRRLGLRLEPPMLHLPTWAAGKYLVPLTSTAATYMFAQVLPNPRWKRMLALWALHVRGGGTLVGGFWPSVALTARRPGGRPLLDWLFRLDGDSSERRCGAISAGWRAEYGSAVVHRFSGASAPSAVAKVSARSRSKEIAALRCVAPVAAAAGVQVPRLLASGCLGDEDRSVLLQSLVGGESVASMLLREPDHLGGVVASVTIWLERWNAATRRSWPVHTALERFLLEPAASLLPDRAAYRAWLAARCARVEQPVPVVAAHNDLTTWNLLDDGGRLGIVDWEVASVESLPLTDFVYAMTDAVAVARRLDLPAALRAWLSPLGPEASVVKPNLRRLVARLSLPRDLVDLCLHACFIGHALNEGAVAPPGGPRPFRQMVEWLASHREAVRDWIGP
jgi:hypothetical protein